MHDSAQIVILTSRFDPHSDVIVQRLGEMGQSVVRLNTEDVPQSSEFHLTVDADGWTGALGLGGGRTIDFSAVRSVLVRRPGPFVYPDAFDAVAKMFADAENKHGYSSLWSLTECRWVSRLDRIRAAGWKPEQLHRASQMGFEIPKTIVTTVPEKVQDFFRACSGKMIVKTLSGPAGLAAAAERGAAVPDVDLRTRFVTEEALSGLDGVRAAPCLFQEYIEKDHELRVTVIDGEVFAAEIHSQVSPSTRVDSRSSDADIPFKATRLPGHMEELCRAFIDSYGLSFGAIDLIRTPDGRIIFLENNPVGQFMFVERRLPELRMTDALVACLVRK
ncbi:hypothetical protein [Nonomuraea insulae]|uniref:ATP-grasp domain-containing protein n=1 Tax=Nonomuraea insulae TaxID=1616787 RepID=A0ABW1D2Y4_9ACTN